MGLARPPCNTLLPASRLHQNKFLLFKPNTLCHFVMITKTHTHTNYFLSKINILCFLNCIYLLIECVPVIIIHTHIHTHSLTQTLTHTHTPIHTHTYTQSPTLTHTQTHTLTNTLTYTHTHTFTHTHTHTHTHTRTSSLIPLCGVETELTFQAWCQMPLVAEPKPSYQPKNNF